MKKQALTYSMAIDSFFGGVKGLAAQKLPFTCLCKKNTYPKKDKDEIFQIPIMNIEDCYKHVRRVHRESIKRQEVNK